MRFFSLFIESVFWFQLFLLPLFVAVFPATIIWNSSADSWVKPVVIGLLIAGAAAGIALAERIRRKHGTCTKFFGRFLGDK